MLVVLAVLVVLVLGVGGVDASGAGVAHASGAGAEWWCLFGCRDKREKQDRHWLVSLEQTIDRAAEEDMLLYNEGVPPVPSTAALASHPHSHLLPAVASSHLLLCDAPPLQVLESPCFSLEK